MSFIILNLFLYKLYNPQLWTGSSTTVDIIISICMIVIVSPKHVCISFVQLLTSIRVPATTCPGKGILYRVSWRNIEDKSINNSVRLSYIRIGPGYFNHLLRGDGWYLLCFPVRESQKLDFHIIDHEPRCYLLGKS